MWNYLTEFVGTFIFLSVILACSDAPVISKALPIGLALAVVVYFGGGVSGGHFNPAVSTMVLVKGGISIETWVGYVIAQVLGGLLALMWYKSTKAKK